MRRSDRGGLTWQNDGTQTGFLSLCSAKISNKPVKVISPLYPYPKITYEYVYTLEICRRRKIPSLKLLRCV